MSERLKPQANGNPQPEADKVVRYTPPSLYDMRFTEGTESEKAMGIDDPNQLVYYQTATGTAVVTLAEFASSRSLGSQLDTINQSD